MREIKFEAWDGEKMWSWEQLVQQNYAIRYFFFVPDLLKLREYTGLKDKNGKEIYEGDIALSSKGNLLCLVTFEDGKFGWDIRYKNPKPNQRKDCFGRSYGNQNEADKLEVIGNIYENPELLEKATAR